MRTLVPRNVCSYSYAGMGYANPHAATSVNGVTYTYDNNGNVTAIGSLDYTWDWRNRLASAERSAGGTTSYGYDHTGQRVYKATGSATTTYPNRYFNVASSTDQATTTKHIFTPDGTLIATIATTTEMEGFGGGGEGFLFGGGEAGTFDVPGSIDANLEGLSAEERAEVRADAVVAANPTGEYDASAYGLHIDIGSISKIEGGVELLVRAWNGGQQLGFGEGGSVETERIRIYNPPVLVRDSEGSVVRSWTNSDGEAKEAKFREDPGAATREVVAHTVSLIGKEEGTIVPGSVGNTTSIFYPDANSESTSVDGHVESDDASWSVAYTATAGDAAEDSSSANHPRVRHNGATYNIGRFFALFDTSAITTANTVTSATLSLYDNPTEAGPAYQDNDGQAYLNVYAATPASNTGIVVGDLTRWATTSYATAIRLENLIDNGYSTFTLNSTGIAAINTTGVSKFSVQEGHDVENMAINTSAANQLNVSAADRAGTTEDPKLTVVHHTAGASGAHPGPISYIHLDHLGGTNEDADVVQTLDYYPYGSQRIATGSFDEQRQFIGEEFDGETEFSYLNARYYQGSRGQFTSQDPVFLGIGSGGQDKRSKQQLRALLSDPQLLNAYSYSRNNPLTLSDPSGEFLIVPVILTLAMIMSS